MPITSEIRYRLNDRDEIVFVSESWDRFAVANDGAATTAQQVLGRPLWDFIADPTTRALYRDVLVRIREGRQVQFTFRCDSPACRRLLEMTVQGAADGGVEFRSRTVSEEDRAAQPLLAEGTGGEGPTIRMCGWCKKVDLAGEWVEVEVAVADLRLLEQGTPPAINHGICDPCFERMVAALASV